MQTGARISSPQQSDSFSSLSLHGRIHRHVTNDHFCIRLPFVRLRILKTTHSGEIRTFLSDRRSTGSYMGLTTSCFATFQI